MCPSVTLKVVRVVRDKFSAGLKLCDKCSRSSQLSQVMLIKMTQICGDINNGLQVSKMGKGVPFHMSKQAIMSFTFISEPIIKSIIA